MATKWIYKYRNLFIWCRKTTSWSQKPESRGQFWTSLYIAKYQFKKHCKYASKVEDVIYAKGGSTKYWELYIGTMEIKLSSLEKGEEIVIYWWFWMLLKYHTLTLFTLNWKFSSQKFDQIQKKHKLFQNCLISNYIY